MILDENAKLILDKYDFRRKCSSQKRNRRILHWAKMQLGQISLVENVLGDFSGRQFFR